MSRALAVREVEVPEPSARERLAAAQSALAAVQKRAAEAGAQASLLAERVWKATAAIEAAKGAANEAARDSIARLADPSAPAPSLTQKEAREAISDAEEILRDLIVARETVEKSKHALADRVRISEMELATAVDAALRDSPELKAMFEAACFHRASLRRLLAAMNACGVSAIEMRRTLMGEPSRSSDAENYSQNLWAAAVEVLKTNPDAPLPGLSQTLARTAT